MPPWSASRPRMARNAPATKSRSLMIIGPRRAFRYLISGNASQDFEPDRRGADLAASHAEDIHPHVLRALARERVRELRRRGRSLSRAIVERPDVLRDLRRADPRGKEQ